MTNRSFSARICRKKTLLLFTYFVCTLGVKLFYSSASLIETFLNRRPENIFKISCHSFEIVCLDHKNYFYSASCDRKVSNFGKIYFTLFPFFVASSLKSCNIFLWTWYFHTNQWKFYSLFSPMKISRIIAHVKKN